MSEFTYGDIDAMGEFLERAQTAFKENDPLAAMLLVQQLDQLVQHHRANGWNDLMTGATLFCSLIMNTTATPFVALLACAEAFGIKGKEPDK